MKRNGKNSTLPVLAMLFIYYASRSKDPGKKKPSQYDE